MDTIKEKICLLSLLQLIFTKPPHQRVLSFQEIQEHLSLEQEEEVEWIVMRALFLGLIRGTIDEVEQRVSVSYIQVWLSVSLLSFHSYVFVFVFVHACSLKYLTLQI